MKKLTLIVVMLCATFALVFAGATSFSGKEMKQVAPAPCPEWYADTEWNVSLWGAYAFVATENDRATINQTDTNLIYGTYDRFLAEDHAWGGGVDIKYFFHRYFGLGIEGFGLTGHSKHAVTRASTNFTQDAHFEDNDHASGGALGTLTLRYPFHCSRFSPYIWGGIGGMFGGRNDRPVKILGAQEARFDNEDESKFAGQVGGGLEFRITPHWGVTGDFSWNFLEGPNDDFGMVRTGLNFGF